MPQIMLPNALGAQQDGADLRRQRQINALGEMQVQHAPEGYAREDQKYQQGQQSDALKRDLAMAQYAQRAPNTREFIQRNIPELLPVLQQHGFDLNAPDDVWKQMASESANQMAAQLGVGPPKPEEYTLSPGSVRMQGAQQIASAPTSPERPQGFELSPGQTRYDATGKPIASLPATSPNGGQPPTGYRARPDGNLEFIPGGPADPSIASSNRNLRPIPASAATGIIANRTSLKQLDRAIEDVQKNPDAFGLWNYAGDAVRQRSDPNGVGPRAKVADIGSLKIHDRSGAAVTVGEQPRLQPFIPTSTDAPDVIVTKLQNLRANLESQIDETEAFYSPDSGYRPLPQSGGATGGMPRIGEVQDGYRYKGGDPSQQSSWERQ